MKRLVRIALIVLGVVLVLMITLPLLFKSRIEAMVKEQVNRNVSATVDWSRFSLSLFRGFPNLSIGLHDVSVVGHAPFEGDTLAALGRFELRANPFSALRRNVEVHSIVLDRPLVNGIVLEDGTANWEAAVSGDGALDRLEEPPAGEVGEEEVLPIAAEEGDASGPDMAVSLKRFAITGGRVFYTDRVLNAKASMEELDLEVTGDFSTSQTDMDLALDIGKINAVYGGIRYMKNGRLALEVVAGANLAEDIYTLKKNEIHLNGLILGAEGVVTLPEEGAVDMDLHFFSKKTDFRSLLSLVPAVYLSDFESLESSGTIQLEGTVTGIMNDTLFPDASLILQVNDGSFSYPGLPKNVSDVQVLLNVDYKGTDMDATVVDLESFHLLVGGNPFDMELQVSTPVSDMQVAGAAEGVIDFFSLQDVVPLDNTSLQGTLRTDVRWDTRLSYIENEEFEKVDMDGTLNIEEVTVETPQLPVPVRIDRLDMEFNPRIVKLAGADIGLGRSDLKLEGNLENFVPFVFADQTVRGSLQVTSQLLDVNELMSAGSDLAEEDAKMIPEDSIRVVPDPAEGKSESAGMKIPENIDFAMSLDMKEIIYDEVEAENLRGSMHVSGGMANLEGLSLEVIEGTVTTTGKVDTRGDLAQVDLDLDMQGVDIPSSYETFVTVERLAPMARYCKGSANVNMSFSSKLDDSFTPLFETIDGNGHVYTKGLQIYDTRSFVRLSELLKNEKFRQLAPDEVNIAFTVRDGRVIVDPFDIGFEDSEITVSGSHGIDMTLDYLLDMDIAKSDLGQGVNELMTGIAVMARGAGINLGDSDVLEIKARITGTFSDPKITTDLAGNLESAGTTVRESMEQEVKEKVEEKAEEMETEARQQASEKAEEIISQAEEEAERLLEEARKAGEELVKEAEAQGDKLVEEAGSNPLKKAAARRAAEELKRQAEKQADAMVSEAEKKGEEIISKAREEAGKL